MTTGYDLPALIGSRICHDLISPLGAIANGVELLSLTGADGTPEIGLIAESVENANARIRFFRVAFGMAASDQNLGAAEVTSILAAVSRNGRQRIVWTPEGEQSRLDIKLAFLALLCTESALPWGGTTEVRRNGATWRVTAEAEKTKIDPRLWDVLANPAASAQVTSAEVHFPLFAVLARENRHTVRTQISPTRIEISF